MMALSRYKAALAAVSLAAPGLALAEKVAGASLPDESRAVEPNRYRIERSYDDTLKFFKVVYPPAKYPRKQIAGPPGVKAVHIENPEAKPGSWDGLNVYEWKGEVKVFVLVRPGK